MENKLTFKKIKTSNSIVIGGMIALGKTTLANALMKHFKNSRWVPELDQKDKLSLLLLEKMYERSDDNLYASLFQLYFVIKRFDTYKKNANQKQLTIFDRSIFEDWLFAKENLNNPFLFNYYQGTFGGICNEVVYETGVPKLYVILTGNWELFKKRIFKRNRPCEVNNYKKNEIYFHRLLIQYESFLVNTCKNYGISYIVIDASLSVKKEVQLILNKLKTLNK